jgi:hypothetical protein
MQSCRRSTQGGSWSLDGMGLLGVWMSVRSGSRGKRYVAHRATVCTVFERRRGRLIPRDATSPSSIGDQVMPCRTSEPSKKSTRRSEVARIARTEKNSTG